MSTRPTTLIPETVSAMAVEERPGAPERVRRRRRSESFPDPSSESSESSGSSESSEDGAEEEVELERPAVRRRLVDAGVPAVDEGVRRLSDVERDCRTLINMALSGAESDRVYTVLGAFIHFAKEELLDKTYMIEEPAIHVSGYIRLKSVHDGEIGVFEAAFLPERPKNLSLLVETMNTALMSELPCFANLKQVFLRLPSPFELHSGLLPSTNSAPLFMVETLSRLHGWGFKAERNLNSNCRYGEHVETIDPDNLAHYHGVVKTRVSALWRAYNH